MNNKSGTKNSRGFTLVEILLVVTIFSAAFYFGSFAYYDWQSQVSANTAAVELMDLVSLARIKSLSAWKDSIYGVKLNPDQRQAIIFRGQSYAERDSGQDHIATFANNILIESEIEENEFVFSKYTGLPSRDGRVTLKNRYSPDQAAVNINDLGLIFLEL